MEFDIKKAIQLFEIEGMIKTTDTVPTYYPTKFSDQFIIYINGATKRFYIYSNNSQAWSYVALT